MAIPKVMISSTCYDLKQIRENLETFIRNLGYESIRSDKGDIGYNVTETLQEDCFLVAQQCDILVGIIGGIFGSEATPHDSVTMQEMKTALVHKKQVYLFVDKNVLTEFRTYKANLGSKGEKFAKEEIVYYYVNDTRIFDFINEMYVHESERVIIEGFQISSDISDFLKKQWANLFQVFLSQKERDAQSGAYSKINASADRLEELIGQFNNNLLNLSDSTTFLLENQGYGKYAANPLLFHLKKLLNAKISILFKTPDELKELMHLYGYAESELSSYVFVRNEHDPFGNVVSGTSITFKDIFNDDKLIFPVVGESMDDYIFIEEFSNNSDFQIIDDDDLPF